MKKGPNETDVLVGTKVRIRRVELGMSQTELATGLGVTFQQVQKYEKGANRIGASRLHAMAGVLRVPVNYFFPQAADGLDHTARPTEILGLLGIPGAMDLLRNFARINDRSAQRALCVMAKTLAKEEHGQPEQAAAGPTATH
jgi:transcriptional regulator with XRE-family HTH domain